MPTKPRTESPSAAACFDGDFTLLPLRASLDGGPVPESPTADEFHNAVSVLRRAEGDADGFLTWEVAAARWRVEAIRERRAQAGAPIDTRDVFRRVAANLHRYTQEAS